MTRIGTPLVDQSTALNFKWNGQNLSAYRGDTLASALLANNIKLVARSFKYHRPRGVFTAGPEEPNALMQLHSGALCEPNTRATTTELFDGLVARSQNHRGPLGWDMMSVNDLLGPFLAAGFYYKTFMWPRAFWEKLYEPAIRSAAGLGALSGQADPSTYDHGYLHCDVLIIGAGPAGLAAALAAGRSGARVIIMEEDFIFGGRLNAEQHMIAGQSGRDWVSSTIAELKAMDNVRLFNRTAVFGAYDHGIYGAVEKLTDHIVDNSDKPRQIRWKIYSKRAILCAGATERSIGFANNDRPGIMLAGAVRTYANRFGVACGEQVAVLTNNDSGWDSAMELAALGINVTAVIDTRKDATHHNIANCLSITGAHVSDTRGRKALRQITLSNGQNLQVDCLAIAGGWSPNVHLTCHHRGRPVWRDDLAAFVPGGELPPGQMVAGACNGDLTLGAALKAGHNAANTALKALGFKPSRKAAPKADDEPANVTAFWHVKTKRRAWVDLQNDVTTKDVVQSHQEGFRAVEHLKRYTTLGMATDQGKTSNVMGLAIMAEASGKTIAQTGTTIFRPPYAPVALGTLAGRECGAHFKPTRLTPSHDWAKEQNATFIEVGQWLRAQWYSQPGETHWRDSVNREALQTRKSVGLCDVSTLGKIELFGRDVGTFLNKVYANGFAKLAVGKSRYGLMLREDGFLYDDGTTARLSENHYVMTTTTANAGLVYRNLEFYRQCIMPELDVHFISTTDSWAQFALAGPNSRALLQKLIEADLSNDAFPFMACAAVDICGIKGRLFRISFSGELAYEVAVPRRYGDALVRALMDAGAEFDVVPYGTEALNVLRIEKGHVTGAELNGQTTAQNVGLGFMVSDKKDSVGTVLSKRPALADPDGYHLVGLRPVERDQRLTAGARFVPEGETPSLQTEQGWVSSVCYSPTFGHDIGLGLLLRGKQRHGETIRAWDGVRERDVICEITTNHMYDPEGTVQRG